MINITEILKDCPNLNHYGNKGWELIEHYKGHFMLKNLI